MQESLPGEAALAATEMQVEFDRLAAEWKEDTKFLSSSHALIGHPAYQRIIRMGEPAVPLILRNLEESGGHWFWALREITGEDPVKPEERGNVRAMTARWMEWWNLRNSPKSRKRINARAKSP